MQTKIIYPTISSLLGFFEGEHDAIFIEVTITRLSYTRHSEPYISSKPSFAYLCFLVNHTLFYFCPTLDCLSYYCVCPVITILVFTQQSSCTQIETVQIIGRTKQFGPNMLRSEQAQGQQHILVLTCDMCSWD